MTDKEFLAIVQEKHPRDVRIGKVTGQVRLYGKAWDALREHIWNREGRKCKNCLTPVDLKKGLWSTMQAAHYKSKGSGADDLPSNTRSLCMQCHASEHAGRDVE